MPGVRFLVALDTGSDLFWVPCECTSCTSSKPAVSGFPVYSLSLLHHFYEITSESVCSFTNIIQQNAIRLSRWWNFMKRLLRENTERLRFLYMGSQVQCHFSFQLLMGSSKSSWLFKRISWCLDNFLYLGIYICISGLPNAKYYCSQLRAS